MADPMPTHSDWTGPEEGMAYLVDGATVTCVARRVEVVRGRQIICCDIERGGVTTTYKVGAIGYGAAWAPAIKANG